MCKQAYKNGENKMKVIKHDNSKFAHYHGFVDALNELGISIKNTLQDALELYKSKHPKQQSFILIHYWLFWKDALYWVDRQKNV
jgi:hypothetical protein